MCTIMIIIVIVIILLSFSQCSLTPDKVGTSTVEVENEKELKYSR